MLDAIQSGTDVERPMPAASMSQVEYTPRPTVIQGIPETSEPLGTNVGTIAVAGSRIGAPRPDRLVVEVSIDSRLEILQQWEGFVETVREDVFKARLYELAAPFGRNEGNEIEIAELFVDDVEPDDRELIVPGAVFRWLIGYRDPIRGPRERVSAIVFRRLPQWTTRDLRASEERAGALANAFR